MTKAKSKKRFTVLFVCTGNSCRSPMAEGILKKKLMDEWPNICVLSAGTEGIEGLRVSDYARDVAAEHGIDLSEHRSRGVSESLLREADLVLTMAREHQQNLRKKYPKFADNVFLLKRFGGVKKSEEDEDVEDPIGMDKDTYRKIFHEIEEEINRIFPQILKLAKEAEKN